MIEWFGIVLPICSALALALGVATVEGIINACWGESDSPTNGERMLRAIPTYRLGLWLGSKRQ